MKSESSQKVIQIGSSIGVTIPIKEARYHGIKTGQRVRMTVESHNDAEPIIRIFKPSWWRRLFLR
jgi:bifunctional DNA-binding transcriptional regulator/antitoxin component of YhaV-PrlF toxin-antitoxin module